MAVITESDRLMIREWTETARRLGMGWVGETD